MRHYSRIHKKREALLFEPSGYKELLSPLFKPKSQQLSSWMQESYERNLQYPENLIYKTISGNRVRSKSEAMIDMRLSAHQIPFRYECALQLGNLTIFPDFTIRHPKTGDFYYWEHFGLMNDPKYYKKTFSKLELYTSHGIVPSIQLITTYETSDAPLSPDVIEELISRYFCENPSNPINFE